MKIILAGGTGFLGSALAQRLSTEGHSVILLSRAQRESKLPGAVPTRWDGKTLGAWAHVFDGADAVINVTGESIGGGRWTKERKQKILRSRVDATNAIVNAIENARQRPRVLINASAIGYYGNVEDAEVSESNPPGNDFLAQTCAQWEAAASRAESFGVRVVLARTAFTLARHAEAFRRMQLPFKLFAGGPYGSGRQWFSWVHLDDVVNGFLFALTSESMSGPMNLVSPNPVRVRELARSLGKAMHRPWFIPAPAFALKIALGEMSDLLLMGQKVKPEKLLKAGFQFRFPTLDGALTEIFVGTRD